MYAPILTFFLVRTILKVQSPCTELIPYLHSTSFELVCIDKRLLRKAQRYTLCLHTSILAMHAVLDLCTDRPSYPLSTREDGSGVAVN